MTAPADRWKLGLFVVAGCATVITGLTWLGMRELRRETHPAIAFFDEALTGLEEGSPVKFRGVSIGVVERINVAPDKKHLAVRASLYDSYLRDLGLDPQIGVDSPLPDNLRAMVVMSWVTSTSFIQVDFFPDPPQGPQVLPFPVPTGVPFLRTVPSTAKSLDDAGREVMRELPALAAAARGLLEGLQTDLAAARLPQLAARLDAVLAQADKQLAALAEHDTVGVATAALQSMRGATSELETALGDLRGAVTTLREEVAATQLPATGSALRAAAASVGTAGDDISAQITHLGSALAAIERLAALLERDPAALLYGRGAASGSPLAPGKR